jgi:cytohesin
MFPHPDVCYVFAFSCIMLNTSLHNPNVQFKPTLEQFIAMNSENENGSASREIFEQTYNRSGIRSLSMSIESSTQYCQDAI